MTTPTTVGRSALDDKVKSMYTDVAANPHGEFHFEMRRAMAERLGYAAADLDRIPAEAIDCPRTSSATPTWWAACIGGGAQRDVYRTAIESAGLVVERVEDNPEYHFISERARKATAKWGVASASLLARKRG
jgi:hypothetical protein